MSITQLTHDCLLHLLSHLTIQDAVRLLASLNYSKKYRGYVNDDEVWQAHAGNLKISNARRSSETFLDMTKLAYHWQRKNLMSIADLSTLPSTRVTPTRSFLPPLPEGNDVVKATRRFIYATSASERVMEVLLFGDRLWIHIKSEPYSIVSFNLASARLQPEIPPATDKCHGMWTLMGDTTVGDYLLIRVFLPVTGYHGAMYRRESIDFVYNGRTGEELAKLEHGTDLFSSMGIMVNNVLWRSDIEKREPFQLNEVLFRNEIEQGGQEYAVPMEQFNNGDFAFFATETALVVKCLPSKDIREKAGSFVRVYLMKDINKHHASDGPEFVAKMRLNCDAIVATRFVIIGNDFQDPNQPMSVVYDVLTGECVAEGLPLKHTDLRASTDEKILFMRSQSNQRLRMVEVETGLVSCFEVACPNDGDLWLVYEDQIEYQDGRIEVQRHTGLVIL